MGTPQQSETKCLQTKVVCYSIVKNASKAILPAHTKAEKNKHEIFDFVLSFLFITHKSINIRHYRRLSNCHFVCTLWKHAHHIPTVQCIKTLSSSPANSERWGHTLHSKEKLSTISRDKPRSRTFSLCNKPWYHTFFSEWRFLVHACL